MAQEFELPFTQYLLPNGEKRQMMHMCTQEVYEKGMAIIKAGYHFEIEILTTGHVSATIGDDDGDYVFALMKNGPDVVDGIAKLVTLHTVEEINNMRDMPGDTEHDDTDGGTDLDG